MKPGNQIACRADVAIGKAVHPPLRHKMTDILNRRTTVRAEVQTIPEQFHDRGRRRACGQFIRTIVSEFGEYQGHYLRSRAGHNVVGDFYDFLGNFAQTLTR